MLDIERINRKRYMGPPTIKQINGRLKKLKMKAVHFELFFGIPEGTLYKVKCGDRPLPVKYWHLFFQSKYEMIPKKPKKKTAAPNPPQTPSLTIVMDVLKDKLK